MWVKMSYNAFCCWSGGGVGGYLLMFSLSASCVIHDLHLGANLGWNSQRCSPMTLLPKQKAEVSASTWQGQTHTGRHDQLLLPTFQVTRMSVAWSCALKS